MDITEWDDPNRIDDLAGGERRVLSATDELMLVHYSLEAGAEGEPHAHDETTQATFVIEGTLELRGERSRTLEAGDSYVVPPGTVHGVRALEACRVIDAFTPPLETYRSE
ncbi:cupin domain-containing protein [Natrinema sp. SYSU A 869]|uniref:cupin domain-containing protein n=1 Tax=Natrinema sp. SYSU A 869 TaxID=2871694 RepID=UPI001CA45C14|nr:cupin domain-containing protein [Natrinema sp. SYSU A 869]